MRTILWSVLAVQVLATLPAEAGSHTTEGGGGALSHVSAGLGAASGGSSSSSSSSSSSGPDQEANHTRNRDAETQTIADYEARRRASIFADTSELYQPEVDPGSRARIDAYVSAQKVHDSNGAFSVEVALRDRRARIGGSVTRFFENQRGDSQALTLTIPSFTLGVRIDDFGSTRVFLEGGVIGAKTEHDPVMNTSLLGVVGGVRVESAVSHNVSLVGDAQAMLFEDHVRATAMRVGVKLGPLVTSMRVFAFNVGPALYGPEVGLAF